MSNPILIAGALTSGFAIGFIPVLADALRKSFHEQFKGAETRADRCLALFYLAWLPAMPLSGWLLDHWRNKEVLFFGLLGCVLGIAWLGLTQSLRSLAASVLILGVGYAWLAVAGIRLMPEALGFTTPHSKFAALNLGFVFVSFGAMVAPGVVAWTVRRWGRRPGLLYLSLALVPVATLVFLAPQVEPPAPGESMAWGALVSKVEVWLLGIAILLYFAIENSLDVWPEPYLREIGRQGRGLTAAMLIFWAAFTLTRAAAGWLPSTQYHYEPWLLLALVLVASCTMGNLAGANEYSSGSLGFWITGACYGPLLPGFLALVMELIPEMPATALGIMLAFSGLDTLIVRPMMTSLAARRPARTVMRVSLLLGLLLAAPLLVLALIR